MSSDLQKQLADVLSGGNGEAAWAMGRRYLSEETLSWSMGANYARTDNDQAIGRFIEAWQSNTLPAMPGENLTPEAKVLFDEIVSNFEDWLQDNELESWEIVMAANAAQSYMTGRAGGVIAVE